MRSCKNFLGVSIGVISLLSLDALGQNEVTVEYSTVGCQSSRWATIGQFDAGAAITITGIESDWTAIRIRPTTSNTTPAIGRVTLGVSTLPSNGLDLILVPIECRPDTPFDDLPANAGSAWAGLTYASGSESLRDRVRLVAAIAGDLTGSVDAGSIFRLQIGGDIIAPVAASSFWFSEPGIQHLVCTQVLNDGTTTHGSIIASTGDIGVVEIDTELSGGELRGPVHASGTISRLIVGGPITISGLARDPGGRGDQ